MKPYPKYKDSGEQWLGQIPEHWEMMPGLSVLEENKEKNRNNQESTVLSLSYGKIIVKENKNEGLVPQEYSSYQIIHPNYIIIRCTDLQNDKVSLRTGIAQNDGIITSAYLGLKVKRGLPAYIHYFLHTLDITKELYRYGSGLRQSLSWTDFKRLNILLPPVTEQEAMVAHLDKQTGDIDKAIQREQAMIDLLEERKQIIIQNAVTKGLNPNAPMKDSGIDWIGEIPENWKMRKIKFIFSELKDRSSKGDEMALSLTKEFGLIPSSQKENRTMESESLVGYKIIHKGEIVFNRFRARLFAVSNYDGVVSPDYAVYSCSDIADAEYMVNLFNTPIYREAFHRKASGIGDGFSRLYTDDLFSMYTIFPSLTEQQAIVSYLKEKLSSIDKAIAAKNRVIALLQERKQIIISEVVTGKIKIS